MQNKKQSRRKTLCVEVERNKMPDPEEDQAGPKVPVQTGRFRPISDRYPQCSASRKDNSASPTGKELKDRNDAAATSRVREGRGGGSATELLSSVAILLSRRWLMLCLSSRTRQGLAEQR